MYNSSYGSYGSSLGGSYGSGSYGNSYSSQYGNSSMYGNSLQRNQQINNINNPNQPNQPQQPNQRKKVFQQYFKMMGGMRSILELGFAGVAFVNFGSKSWELLKKIFIFLLNNSKRFLSFVQQYIPISAVKNAIIVTTGAKGSIKAQNIIFSLVRIVLITFLAGSYYLLRGMKQDVLLQHQQLSKKAQQIQKKRQLINKNMEKYQKQSNL